MRVVHVLPSLAADSGGPARSVTQLCTALARVEVEVRLIVAARGSESMVADVAKLPFPVEVLPYRRMRGEAAITLLRASRELFRHADVVHIHSVWNSIASAGMRAAIRRRLPIVVAPRGMLDPYNLERRRAAKWLYSRTVDRDLLARATRMHFLNSAEADGARNGWSQLPPHFIAPNGVQLPSRDRSTGWLARREPALSGRRTMVFLGRLHAIKALELQLDALDRLRTRHADIAWVLIGPDDGEWRSLSARAEAMGIRDRVFWLGPINGDERLEAIADASVFVQTSRYECHSMAVNEALAVGVPVVVTQGVHFPEVQIAGAGLVCRHDALALTAAVDEVLNDSARARAMAVAGRAYAREALAWPTVAKTVLRAYEEIVQGDATSGAHPSIGP